MSGNTRAVIFLFSYLNLFFVVFRMSFIYKLKARSNYYLIGNSQMAVNSKFNLDKINYNLIYKHGAKGSLQTKKSVEFSTLGWVGGSEGVHFPHFKKNYPNGFWRPKNQFKSIKFSFNF